MYLAIDYSLSFSIVYPMNLDAIRQHLPGLWVIKPFNVEDSNRGELTREDGLVLHFSINQYGLKGKMTISLSRPCYKGGWVEVWEEHNKIHDPSINVSDTKSPEQIARDIERRLLADCEKVFKLVNERIARDVAYENKKLNNLKAVAEVAGQEITYHYHNKEPYDNIYLMGLRGQRIGRVHVTSYYIEVKLDSMPLEKAKKLIDFLRTNLFA